MNATVCVGRTLTGLLKCRLCPRDERGASIGFECTGDETYLYTPVAKCLLQSAFILFHISSHYFFPPLALLYSDRDVTATVILSLRPSVREIFLAWMVDPCQGALRRYVRTPKKVVCEWGRKNKSSEEGEDVFFTNIFLDIIYAMGKENVMRWQCYFRNYFFFLPNWMCLNFVRGGFFLLLTYCASFVVGDNEERVQNITILIPGKGEGCSGFMRV